MKKLVLLAVVFGVVLTAGVALAGTKGGLPVPTLGEFSLVLLGLGLVGGGIASLRRRRS